ncbi:phage portal protein [Alkalihalobacillus trypoxylicola]|uniref:phage portal protein n=1 Tax=Alkalihalobacillus trypoxylicola TaxID=519424 RepID=UPI001F3FA0AD|nr:phage portal protein [Alkalihalobacillus trypoxylicola]
MGLIKALGDVTEHKDIEVNKEMFEKIELWKNLYKGYHKPWHNIEYNTIKGPGTRDMETLNVAKVAAAEMASLVFNEKCSISIGDTGTEDFIVEQFNHNKFNKRFQDYLEYSFAHGGMAIKPYIEDGQIKLTFVTADCCIPISWSNDTITEMVFPNTFTKKGKSYTHLEWHLRENGSNIIRNEVYESTNGDDLGYKVSLSDHFPDLEEEVVIPIKRTLFTYFKPNTANNIDTRSPLGISLFANALDTMKAIHTAFDSFHREFRLGKKRIYVPAHMVKTVIDEQGVPVRYFDATDEAYEAFGGTEEGDKIQESIIELRVEEHISGINALLNLYAMQTGFSGGAFTFDGNSMKTATEVVSEQSKTFKSKQSHETIIESGLQDLIYTILELANWGSIYKNSGNFDITVGFDDSIAEDKGSEIKQQIQLVTSNLQSKKRAIMRIHDVTEKEALEILTEINEENKVNLLPQTNEESLLYGAIE